MALHDKLEPFLRAGAVLLVEKGAGDLVDEADGAGVANRSEKSVIDAARAGRMAMDCATAEGVTIDEGVATGGVDLAGGKLSAI
ncbi:hypothetical protein Ga0100231_025070 [Opitutaceae bacterium TAV4]|nr:hypothetical protein Ga0100231_025005 [Opitutaceae bacterium TAV4]RRJ97014.1 hypothetical protein Ga0100231_025070 [Opitutaceae bacterium TAV4]RRK00983.1 hypothetical protein Ga0100230_024810 [Opitutaceae bacterium TAV3]